MGLWDRIFGKKKIKKTRARAVRVTKAKPKRKRKTEHITLREWRAELKRLQSHPLTQAKIINERLLNSIMELLEQINLKLNALNTRIDRLEVKREKKPKEVKPKVKLSKQEELILDFIREEKKAQASPVANMLKISRSNASLKLNKLFSVGLLEKKQDGKNVFYKIK